MYNGYRISFDSASSWCFDNDIARNVIIFGVDNSSSSHADIRKNNFLVLGESPTFGINERFDLPEKKICIDFSKANTNFCLSLHYKAIIGFCLLMEKKSLKLKPTIKILTFQIIFVSETYIMNLVLLSLEKYL